MRVWITMLALPVFGLASAATAQTAAPVGVVANIKVLSDKVEDVSSVEAWKQSYITDGMSDQDKALAIWRTVTRFRLQTYPPCEGIESDGGHVHDAIKMFNVYGYCQCCCAAACVEYLGRCVGLETRGWSINTHSVAEVKYGGTWHMLDGAYMEYWLNGQGQIAGVEEINSAVMGWYKANPAARGKAAEYGPAKGPPLMSRNEFFEKNHLPLTGPWAGAMHAFEFEKAGVMNNAYVQGYRVNIQLREGERLTRNWFNKGLEINPGGAECMGPVDKPIHAALGDRAPLRIGNGTHEYTVPLGSETFWRGVLQAVNVAGTAEDQAAPAVHVRDAAAEGYFVVRMSNPYVYLGGKLALKTVVGNGGVVAVLMSTNHGLDYKPVASFNDSGEKAIPLPESRDCYDYRLKFVLKGQGTGLDNLALATIFSTPRPRCPRLPRAPTRSRSPPATPRGPSPWKAG